MKHVTIAPSPDRSSSVNPTLVHGFDAEKSFPGHMIPIGQDGYRTPTIEDYEKHSESNFRLSNGNGGFSNPSPLNRLPNSSNDVMNHTSANASNVSSLAERLLEKLECRQRLRHFTWTFFTITMATGGIANVLYEVPFRFPGLYAIGAIFFLLNIVLFLINVVAISLRFWLFPETFIASFLHPTERLFIPAAVVSFGTILLNISQYGPSHAGQWLNDAIAVLFWVDAALAVLASTGIYLIMWSTASFTIAQMTPIWIFPAYPLLILGPHAGVLSQTIAQKRAFDIIVGGFTLQGIGFMVSLMIYSAFIYRLMTQKLPQEATRPGMFVSVGPSAFTAAGIVGMAEGAQRSLPLDFMGDSKLAATILRVTAAWMSLWFWGLAIWFFIISMGAHWPCLARGHTMSFTMSWFSYVFPNTALVTSTFAIGRAFECRAIQILGCVMTPILIGTWFIVTYRMIKAVIDGQILWPQKGEDKDEGGFKGPRRRNESV